MKKNIFLLFFVSLILVSCGNQAELKNDSISKTKNTPVNIEENSGTSTEINNNKIKTSFSGTSTEIKGGSGEVVDKETEDTMKEIDKIIDDISKE